jgi:hypothetical protein
MSAALHLASYRSRRNRVFGAYADSARRAPARARTQERCDRLVRLTIAQLAFAVLGFPGVTPSKRRSSP